MEPPNALKVTVMEIRKLYLTLAKKFTQDGNECNVQDLLIESEKLNASSIGNNFDVIDPIDSISLKITEFLFFGIESY